MRGSSEKYTKMKGKCMLLTFREERRFCFQYNVDISDIDLKENLKLFIQDQL